MFEIDVVSEPTSAFSVDGIIENDDFASLARYDESLVKPALLLADHVNLATARVDMMRMTKADAFENNRMPMRFLHRYAWLSKDRDQESLRILGLTQSALASAADLAPFTSGASPADPGWWDQVGAFEIKYKEQIMLYRRALGEILAQRWRDLQSTELELATEAGILTIDAWNAEESSPFSLSWHEVAAQYWAAAVDQMTTRLGSRPHGLMMETYAKRVLGIEDAKASRAGDSRVSVATMLAGAAPALSSMTVAEILDLRKSASDHLAPFRSEMLRIADEVTGVEEMTTAELAAEVEWRWARDVQPALSELEHDLKHGRYGSQLINSWVDDKGGAVAGGIALVAGVGTIFAGLAALVPAGIAATYPFVQALNETRKANAAAKKHRLYFLHTASAQVAKRKKTQR